MCGELSLTPHAAALDSNCNAVSRSTSGRTSPVGLLPCLQRESMRWWLPRSHVATEALGRALLATGRGQADDETHQGIVSALLIDPPLLIYAALGWPGERAELDDLADWLTQHAADLIASGEAYLDVPAMDQQALHRWNQLRDHWQTVPIHQWLDGAPLWLEVTGPRVPESWRDQWPVIAHSAKTSCLPIQTTSDSWLQQLARMVQHQQSLQQSFDERLRTSKMDALKELAYGLSHEINNPLANISTRAQQLQRGEDDTTRVAVLQRIVDQVFRAHDMIADMMFFANPPSANLLRCNLNETLVKTADSFQEEAERQAIRLEVKAPSEATEVMIDATMIGEALRALIRNSIDAIGYQGAIVVSLVRDGERLMIHVADSGPGISDQAREHAFDPYFSGREAGRGLGLGLCRAYRIAKLHHGDVTLAGGPIGCVATITLDDVS